MLKDHEKHYTYAFLLILALVAAMFFLRGFTGYVTDGQGVDVSVRNRTNGDIIAFDFKSTINLTEAQQIFVEFLNTGTVEYTSRTEVNIYQSDGVTLNLTAVYQDSSAFLYPGGRKPFTVLFIANETGLYFIQVRVTFGTRVIETWGAFFVVDPSTTTGGGTTGGGTTGGGGGGGGGSGGGGSVIFDTAFKTIKVADAQLDVEAPAGVEIGLGDELLIPLRAVNTGKINLSGVRPFVSADAVLNAEVNPKVLPILRIGDSYVFVVSFRTDEYAQTGTYAVAYEIVANEARKEGAIEVNVTDRVLGIDDIRQRILNYQILILELDGKLLEARLRGVEVDDAEISLSSAKRNLDSAKRHFDTEDYPSARKALVDTKNDIEDAVFLLATAEFFIYQAAAIDLYMLIIILLAMLAVAVVYMRLSRKKAPARPKILREATEE